MGALNEGSTKQQILARSCTPRVSVKVIRNQRKEGNKEVTSRVVKSRVVRYWQAVIVLMKRSWYYCSVRPAQALDEMQDDGNNREDHASSKR